MRHAFNSILVATCIVSVGQSAIPYAPANWESDDIVTLIYDPVHGSFVVDNPAGDDAAADAITTFELTSSVDFFTGPAPHGFDGLFDVWSPTKAFRLFPAGFYDMSWPAGSVATGLGYSDLRENLTLNGSFLSGGPLSPVDLCCIPEPNSNALLLLGTLCLTGACRRRI